MSQSEVQIRPFQTSDEQNIKSLIDGIMTHEFPQSRGAYPATDLGNISTAYGDNGECFFVATDRNRIVGTVAIKKEDERIALLRRLFVDPQYRKKQIGARLLDSATQFCKKNGYQEMVFRTSSKMDGAINLCKKKGFHQRAKLEIGGSELLKFVLFLGDHAE